MTPLDIICQKLIMPKDEVLAYISRCPHRYKKFEIPKRNGEKRLISQPTPDLKFVQKILVEEFLSKKLPVHSQATAYIAGKSIYDNANAHSKNNYLLKMDFRDFFSSIKSTDLVSRLIEVDAFESNDTTSIDICSKVFFMDDKGELVLSTGAPSSPLISNAIMYSFDNQINDLCLENGIAYTRYSDDLSFSCNHKDILFAYPAIVERILRDIKSPSISINSQKTVFSSKADKRRVTGLIINNNGNISLGREKKREIRTLVYLFQQGKLEIDRTYALSGYISYAKSVEPNFVQSLNEKYPEALKTLISLDTRTLAKRPKPIIHT